MVRRTLFVLLPLAMGLYGKDFVRSFHPARSLERIEHKSTGGPDYYGYLWIDSEEPEGPVYNWIDITETGTEIENLGDDEVRGPFSIGFNFSYYWYTVDEFYFSTNGAISFSDNILYHVWPSMDYTTELPSAIRPNDILVPLGGDLIFGTTGGGRAYYWTNNTDTCIISWIGVPEWNNSSGYYGSHTFQIILTKEDSCITFQYGSQVGTFRCGTVDDPKTAIGIENCSGIIGLQYLQDNIPSENIYRDSLAVRFIPPSEGVPITDITVLETTREDNKSFFMIPYGNLIPWVRIKNQGSENVTDFFSGVYIYKGSEMEYGDSVSVSLLSTDEDTLSFTTYTQRDTGIVEVRGWIDVPGDMVPANDIAITEFRSLSSPWTFIYDDGEAENAYIYHEHGNGWATCFTPPTYPVRLDTLFYYFWDMSWPSPGGNDAIFQVLDDGDSGSPGTVLWADTVTGGIVRGEWNAIPLDEPVVIPDGSFYVAYIQYADSIYAPGFACDETPNLSHQGWIYSATQEKWQVAPGDPDWMIRAKGRFAKDVGISSLIVPSQYVIPDSAIKPVVSLKNFGYESQDFTLHLVIDSAGTIVYNQSESILSLGCGEEIVDTLSPWTPGNYEGYELTAYTELTGDLYPANDSLYLTIKAIGGDFLVWDPDPDHSSGPVVRDILTDLGYEGHYTESIAEYGEGIKQYDMLFVFCGQSPNTYQIQDGSPEAIAIQSFLEDGKNIYIEGGDVWYYDPGHGGFDFNPYFGDTAISDGTTSPVDSVIGIDGTLFDGMRFAYSGESKYSDKIDSRGCVIGFVDEGAEGIGWYYVHPTYGSRTFGFTGELSGLSDEEYPNTKEEVIKKIVGFFHTGIEEGNNVMSYKTWVYPNPVAGFCVFRYQLPKTSSVRIKIYDITGRQVRFLNEREKEKGVYDIRWNCMDMPSGVYFINFELGEKSFTRKLVAIKR